ncbi:MAG: hypothetical protein ACRD0K_13695 [Egibacteraceae bacterium]
MSPPARAIEWPAALLLPPARGVALRADDRWRFDPRALDTVSGGIVWGRAPLPAGAGKGSALDAALRREIALRRVRREAAKRRLAASVHRISATGAGGPKDWVRRAARGGALVELASPDAQPRLLDAIARAAGAALPAGTLRLGSGGAALARVRLTDGTDALLRMAPAGSPGDPSMTAARLDALAAAHVDLVPRLRGAGAIAGIAWTVESLLPGRRPRRVSAACARDAAAFCALLPKGTGSPTAPREDLTALATVLDGRAPALRRLINELEGRLGAVPAVMRHGDLWAGNLLVSGGRLRGVVDWDSGHPNAVPGTDILQLIATERRRRGGLALGEVWLQRPWRWTEFATATESYWPAVGLRLTDELAELLALAWWATETAGTLRRLPHRAADGQWLAANVDPVLSTMSRCL